MKEKKTEILSADSTRLKGDVDAVQMAIFDVFSERGIHYKDAAVIMAEVMLNITHFIKKDCNIDFLEMTNDEITVIVGDTLRLQKNMANHSLQNKEGSAGGSKTKH